MAAVTRFRTLIDCVPDFRRVRGIADVAFTIEDANPHHSRLIRHGGHGVIQAFPVVAQHVIGGAALDDIADALGAGERGRFEMLPVQTDVQIAEQAKNPQHHQQQQADQLGADAMRQPFPLPPI